MLVRFDSKAGTFTTFGHIAVQLLHLMGQSGSVPGAILAADIPAAVERLKKGVSARPAPAGPQNPEDDEESPVGLGHRALPLIELLERADKSGADVMWERE